MTARRVAWTCVNTRSDTLGDTPAPLPTVSRAAQPGRGDHVQRAHCLVKGCPVAFASGSHRLCGMHRDEAAILAARERAQAQLLTEDQADDVETMITERPVGHR